MSDILKVIPPTEYDRPNLEEIFTLLDLADRGVAPLELRNTDWKALRAKFMGMVVDSFLAHQWKVEHDPAISGKVSGILGRWASFLDRGDTIITFNWDLLHESALWKAGKWHYANGYGFSSGDLNNAPSSQVKVLKLHGSVNWAQVDETDCSPTIEYRAEFFGGALDDGGAEIPKSAGQWNEGRNLIIPSFLKDLSSNLLLLHIWNQAYDHLSRTRQVVVIGFGLHPADAPARQLISSALIRNETLNEITVVSPTGGLDEWEGFCSSLRKSRIRIPKTFKDWISST